MDEQRGKGSGTGRRSFLKAASGAGVLMAAEQADASPLTEKQKLDRIASNTWPIRYIFKTRGQGFNNPRSEEMKKKYGELTMLDFPQFTKDTFPGVTHMDLFSGLFGDVTDESMYTQVSVPVGDQTRTVREFDPSSASGKRWLDKMANTTVTTDTG